MVLIVVAFVIVGTLVMNETSRNLVNQRVASEIERVEALAQRAAEPLSTGNAAALHDFAKQDGRVLIVDARGVVQVDPYGIWLGTRLHHPEVRSVVDEERLSDANFHPVPARGGSASLSASQSVMSVSAIVHRGDRLGALILVSPADDLKASIDRIQHILLLYFVAVALAVVALGYWISGYISRPINALNRVMTHAMRGDFSARAAVKGRDEVAQLGSTFNMMAEKLENLDSARSTFISNASHELKTPLSGIKLMTENMLHDPAMPADVRADFLGDINKEIDRMTALIGDLLTLVHVDSKGMRLDLSVFDLGESAKSTLKRLRPLAKKRDISFTIEICSPASVCADRLKIDQVLYNLMDNAIKYTPDGGSVRVVVGQGDGEAYAQVHDTGYGIPEADIRHIFDRFFRVDKARSRASGGTGLGLAIVRDIIKLHGGEIDVDSIEDQGSVFTLTLPMHEEEEPS